MLWKDALAAQLGAHGTAGMAVPPQALAQRVQLLDALWADMGRARPSALSRLFPPALLPSHARRPATVTNYAVDLVRMHDGVWRVKRDRVGAHPGAAVLAMPVLAVFLPTLCRALLGQSLMLPSIPTWWLADRETRSMLATHPHRLGIRSAIDPDQPALPLAGLPAADRRRLQRQVDQAPGKFAVVLQSAAPDELSLTAMSSLAMLD